MHLFMTVLALVAITLCGCSQAQIESMIDKGVQGLDQAQAKGLSGTLLVEIDPTGTWVAPFGYVGKSRALLIIMAHVQDTNGVENGSILKEPIVDLPVLPD